MMLNELFTGQSLFFSVPAVAGTLFFAVRLALSFVGLEGADHDFDAPELDIAGADPHHSTAAFKFLSIQGIFAFMMGFGWGGIGGMHGTGWEFGPSLASAMVGGIVMVWLLSWLLKLVHDLQSSGTVSIAAALNVEGDVYVTIPEKGHGMGQVRVIVDQRQRIYNAFSEDRAIPTNTRIRVMRINDDNTLTVAPV